MVARRAACMVALGLAVIGLLGSSAIAQDEIVLDSPTFRPFGGVPLSAQATSNGLPVEFVPIIFSGAFTWGDFVESGPGFSGPDGFVDLSVNWAPHVYELEAFGPIDGNPINSVLGALTIYTPVIRQISAGGNLDLGTRNAQFGMMYSGLPIISVPGAGSGFLNLPRASITSEVFLTDPFNPLGGTTFVTGSVMTAKLFYSAGTVTGFQLTGYGYFRQGGGPRI